MVRTCTEFHKWLLCHNLDPSQYTLVVRANNPQAESLVDLAFTRDLEPLDQAAKLYAEVARRKHLVAGIHLVITSLDQLARVK